MELDFINWLRDRLPRHPRLRIGPGDDAAVLRLDDPECVVTTDMLADSIDFELKHCDAKRAGRKALAVNLSDLAAMGAMPWAATISITVPRLGGLDLAKQLVEGMLPLADEFDVAIAGGDTNSWDGPAVISITAIGRLVAEAPWTRSGAQPGDRIVVTGSFGGSIRGKHFDFRPRLDEARYLAMNYTVHAAIDVSDGLSIDLNHIAKESGCGAVLDAETVPISADADRLAAASSEGLAPLDHALSDGEDFELILAMPKQQADSLVASQPLDVSLTGIGEFIEQPGLWQRTAEGALLPLEPRGYEHRLE